MAANAQNVERGDTIGSQIVRNVHDAGQRDKMRTSGTAASALFAGASEAIP